MKLLITSLALLTLMVAFPVTKSVNGDYAYLAFPAAHVALLVAIHIQKKDQPKAGTQGEPS